MGSNSNNNIIFNMLDFVSFEDRSDNFLSPYAVLYCIKRIDNNWIHLQDVITTSLSKTNFKSVSPAREDKWKEASSQFDNL